MNRHRRLALDAALFLGFLLAANPQLTGLTLHEWLGLAVAAPAIFHLIINWDWVRGIIRSAIVKLRATSRVNFVIDLALFVSAVAVTLSGVLVLPGVAEFANASTIWYRIHSLSSDATVALLLAHLAMHGRWVARTVAVRLEAGPAGAATARARRGYIAPRREGNL